MVYQRLDSKNGYILEKIYQDQRLVFILKERKLSSIKGHRTRFYLTLPNHKYFSSLFESPDYRVNEINPHFNIEDGKTYYLDNNGNDYTLVFNGSTLEIANQRGSK